MHVKLNSKFLLSKGRENLQEWTKQLTNNPDKQTCIAKLRQALETCDRIRQDFLSQKTAFAIGKISPIAEHLQSEQIINQSIESIDAFNILLDLGEFNSGFNALEDEFFRLKAETEVSQEFDK